MESQINYTNITSSVHYQNEKNLVSMKGSKRALQMALILFLLVIPLLWPVLIFYAYNYYQKNKQKTTEQMALLHEFANINGYNFVEHHKGFASTVKSNITVDLPYKYETSFPWYEMRGGILGYPFLYAMLSTTMSPSNKDSSMTSGTFTIFSIDLPVSFPRMFIDSKSNNLGVLDGDAVNFIQSEDHKLEGDFYQYFNVRIEKSEHIDMYRILTPEVMDFLKRNNYYDVWLSGNKLTLITFGDQRRYFAGLPTMFETAMTLTREIDKIARALRQQAY